MKNNEELQRDVQDALKWEPSLNAAEIGVIAKDGVVTLTGIVDSFSKKSEAEDAAKRVSGVKAVVEKISVQFNNKFNKSDADIVNDILNAFKWNLDIPADKVNVKIEDGWVTLEGDLHWNHQKEAAKNASSKLAGVKGVTNNIKIKSEAIDTIEKRSIEQAFKRHWSLEDRFIQVEVTGNTVTLLGNVNSWYQRDEAARIAWNAPGVNSVNNELLVDHDLLKLIDQ